MTVRLAAGGAGAGRTALCTGEIARACRREPEGHPLLLIVPEQATYEAERALVERTGGYVRARVLSFTRLGEIIAAEFPPPETPRLGPGQRALLVARIVQRRRLLPGADPIFRVRGIEDALLAFLSEAHRNLLDPDVLRRGAADSRVPGLGGKCAALAEFLEDYRAAIRERFEDPQESLRRMADLVSRSDALMGAEVWIDGFFGFTASEEGVLGALMKRCRACTVTLPMPAARLRAHLSGVEPAPHPVLHPIDDTARRLVRLMERAGIGLPDVLELPQARNAHRFADAPAHAHLAAHFMSRGAAPHEGECPLIRLVETDSRRDEARLAAEACARWIARDGIDPGRIAIIARSLGESAPALAGALRELGIPHFVDRNEPLATHPLVQGITAAMRVAMHGWQAEDVLEFARSGMAGVERRDVDRLAAWCSASPPSAGDWRADEAWSQPPERSFDEDDPHASAGAPAAPAVDATRRAIAARLGPFARAVAPDGEVSFTVVLDAVAALVDLHLASLGAPPEGDEAAILRRLGELMAEAAQALGGDAMPPDLAAEHVHRILSMLALPRIPPTLGQVIVAQADRSRFPPLDAVVLVGWNAGEFPARTRNRTILNDDERAELLKGSVEVSPPSREDFLRESFLAWHVLTRTTGPVLLVRARGFGREPLPPSPFWEEVRRLLPRAECGVAPPMFGVERAARPREAAAAVLREALAAHEGGEPLDAARVERALAPLPRAPEVATVAAAATGRDLATLPPDDLHAAFGGKWSTSISALETWSRCPFKHFAQSVLRPGVILPPEPDARDAGMIAHAILRAMAGSLASRGESFASLGARFDAAFAEAARGPVARAEALGIFRTATGRHFLDSIVGATRAHAQWMASMQGTLPMRPIAAEASFGTRDAAMPPLRVRVQTAGGAWEASVRGQIDRIDECMAAGARHLLVVDYKLRGDRRFRFDEWADGVALQLPVYLLAVAEAHPDATASAGLYQVVVPGAKDRDAIRQGEPGRVRMRGIARESLYADALGDDVKWGRTEFLEGAQGDPGGTPSWGTALTDEDFEALLDATRGMVEDALSGILGGDATPAPLERDGRLACEQCDFRPMCRFDPIVHGVRTGNGDSRAAHLARLRGGEEEP